MPCVTNNRCGQEPVWLKTYMVDDLCGCDLTLYTTGRDVDCKWSSSTDYWTQYGLQIEYYNSTNHWPQWKIDLRRLNHYKNFSTMVFLLSFYWVRSFFSNQSIILLSFKVTLPLIDVIFIMARPRWLELQWFRPTMAWPPMARLCSTKRKRGWLSLNGSIKKIKKH